MLVRGVAMISQYAALGLNTDIQKGIFDRLRSIAFWRPAVIVGSLFGDMLRYAMAALVVILLGMILGLRSETGWSGIAMSLGLALVFAFSLSWVWTTVGLLMNRAESVSMVSSLVNFLLMFISNVFVQTETMPGFLQQYVKINPFGLTVTAVRGLKHGDATGAHIGYVFLSCAVMVAIFAPLTMYLYKNKNAD